ncbi:MAG: radical SAM protein, partial [Gemmatimonadota bacterium]|nr:radical SAM protein [Gemmatimonadota bacterium]
MHLFQTEEQKQPIVYQVETGLFYKLDTLFQSILECCEGLSVAQVVQVLADQYEAEEVVQAIEELAQVGLVSDGALPLVSHVPTTEGVAACGVSQTDRLQVSLHVSHTCNIQCAYCFAHGGDYGGKAMLMQPDVAEQAIRWIVTEAQVFGRCQIDFFGGEPLLNFPLMRKLVPFAKSLGARLGVQVGFGIVTNGTLLTDEMKQFLVDEKFQIKVSLDGGRKTQDRIRKFHNGSGTYDVVAKNVKKLTAEVPERVYLQAVMTAYDLDEDQIADDLRSLGTENALIGPAVVSPDAPYAIGEEHIPVLKQQIYKRSRRALKAILNGEESEEFDPRIQKLLTRAKSCHGCLGGKQYLAIAADGSIYFCSSLADAPE